MSQLFMSFCDLYNFVANIPAFKLLHNFIHFSGACCRVCPHQCAMHSLAVTCPPLPLLAPLHAALTCPSFVTCPSLSWKRLLFHHSRGSSQNSRRSSSFCSLPKRRFIALHVLLLLFQSFIHLTGNRHGLRGSWSFRLEGIVHPVSFCFVPLQCSALPLLIFVYYMTYADHIASGRCIKFIEEYMAQEVRAARPS